MKSLAACCILLQATLALPQDQIRIISSQECDDANSVTLFSGNRNASVVHINHPIHGNRNVSYFLTQNGLAIIDGDVVFGTEPELLSYRETPGSTEKLSFSAPAPWPGAKVTYKFDSVFTELNLNSEVNTAISRWRAVAPYLTFTQVPSNAANTNGVLTIRNSACDGCHADIGYANTPRSMNLQQGCGSQPGSCGPDQATHEFGHVLGLYHEHQRPDRESYVHYSCPDLDPACRAGSSMPQGTNCCNPAPNCCLRAPNFGIINSFSDPSGGYDIHSIMHYIESAFALPGTETLISVNPAIVVPKIPPGVPSAMDADRICKLYGTWCPRAQQCSRLGCPTSCSIRPRCNSPRCGGDFAPPCCDPGDDNEQCKALRKTCSISGCEFLR